MRRYGLLLACLLITLSALAFPQANTQPTVNGSSFGNTEEPTSLDWSRFWSVFNDHSAWDLEYNNGSGWISRRSDLQVVKNYSRLMGNHDGSTYREYNVNVSDADAVKIGLNFSASFTADYRLSFMIDLDVRNYTYRSSAWNYTIVYQNYTVYFDFSDVRDLNLDAVNHGVMPVGDESYFWFRIRKNNIAEGTSVFIDPTFGNDDVAATLQNWSGAGYIFRLLSRHTPTSGDGTLDSITIYNDFGEAGTQNMSCAFYFGGNNTFIAESEIRQVSGDGWYTFTFSGSPAVVNNTQYGLAFWGETGAPTVGYRYNATGGSLRYASEDDWNNWDTTFSGTDTTRSVSIFANYTLTEIGQDLAFILFESSHAFASLAFSLEVVGLDLAFTLFENSQAFASMTSALEVLTQDLAFILFESGRTFASMTATIDTLTQDLTFILFESGRTFASMIPVLEVAGLDLTFILFESSRSWSSLSATLDTITQDLTFVLFESGRTWATMTSVLETSGVDLTFILFETSASFASATLTTVAAIVLQDVLGIAIIGFILAVAALTLAVIAKQN